MEKQSKPVDLYEEKATKWVHGFWVGETTHAILMKEARRRQQNLNQYMRKLAIEEAEKIRQH
jgi:hypothetical protein